MEEFASSAAMDRVEPHLWWVSVFVSRSEKDIDWNRKSLRTAQP